MKPINNKSLIHFVFDQMEKLDNKEIGVNEAKAQAGLVKVANESLRYEIERARLLMDLDKYNRQSGTDYMLRNVEGKNFD